MKILIYILLIATSVFLGNSVFAIQPVSPKKTTNVDKTESKKVKNLSFIEKLVIKKVRKKLSKRTHNYNLATTGLVFAILGLIIPVIPSVIAIIICTNALKKYKQTPDDQQGKGLAIAGLLIGIIGGIFWIIASQFLFG